VKAIDRNAVGVDQDGVSRFVKSCRIMKRWRDEMFTLDAAPSSILLVTMLGKHDPSRRDYSPPLDDPLYPKYLTDIAYLYDMLRLTHSCMSTTRRTAFMHPTISSEDLSRGWDTKHLAHFMEQLQRCIDNIRLGIYEADDASSIKHYQNAFGTTFPMN
jgi:hypothetical protein